MADDSTMFSPGGYVCGRHRAPLPHESVLSSLWYLGWRNALSRRELFLLCAKKKIPSRFEPFLDPSNWLDPEKLAKLTGWVLPSRKQILSNRFHNIWLSPNLRLCPLCLEHGYHSHWFQLLDLHTCPVHGCQITEVCQACGAKLPPYAFGKALFGKHYHCPTCRKPLCGALPNLLLFDEFEAHRDEVFRRFAAFDAWEQHFAEIDYEAYCIRQSRPNWTLWCRPELMLHELGRRCNPLPSRVTPASSSGFEVLRWGLKMQERPFYLRHSRYSIDFKPITQVLRAFFRRLEYWVFGGFFSKRMGEVLARSHNHNGRFRLSEWDRRELAFCLFWTQYSNDSYTGYRSEIWHPYLHELPQVGFFIHEGRIARVALMNVLLGLFAGLYLTIARAQKNSDTIDFKRLALYEADLIAKSCSFPKKRMSGIVIFPKIDGFPVKWSAAIRMGYERAQRRGEGDSL